MVLPFRGIHPVIAETAFVAPTAVVLGDVEIGGDSSVWYGTVVRGDVHSIRIGAQVNLQDNSVFHVTAGRHPLAIGSRVSVGHRAVVHGCTLGDRVLVGIGAVVLDGAFVGDDSIVGAGSVVPEGTEFPPRSVLLGVPARRVREVTAADLERIEVTCESYLSLLRALREPPP